MSCSSSTNLTPNEVDNEINSNLSEEPYSIEKETIKKRGKAKDMRHVISYDTYDEAYHYIMNNDGFMDVKWKLHKNEVSKIHSSR
jgi:hypothetical protein